MTEEQLNALEVWIESIIEDLRLDSDILERLRRRRLKDDVRGVFNLPLAGDY